MPSLNWKKNLILKLLEPETPKAPKDTAEFMGCGVAANVLVKLKVEVLFGLNK